MKEAEVVGMLTIWCDSGTECILHVYGRWVPWIGTSELRAGFDRSVRRGIYLLRIVTVWHAPVVSSSNAEMHQTCLWRGNRTVSLFVGPPSLNAYIQRSEHNSLKAIMLTRPALIGLTYSAGIGAITGDRDTPVTLGGCVPSEMVDGVCPGGARMRNPTLWVGIFCGGILTCVLMMYRVKGAIIAGILLVSVISWPRPTNVTYFPYSALGNDSFDFFKKVVTFHKIESTLVQQEWDLGQAGGQFGLALITFLYVDILDATGTMYSMARFCGAIDERTQDFEGSAMAYTVDALSISIGSLFGSSPVTAFVESGAGISEGGKTGLTAMTTGVCFFVSIFFSPIFASIPPWATGCTLILVGSMMVRVAADINWRYMGDAIPAFVCLAVMPFTYSIAYGLIAGILTYALLNTLVKVVEVLSCGKIVPENKEFKDPWTYKVPGGVLPGWQRRLARGKRDFWREDEDELGEASAGAGAGAGSESQVELDGVVKGGLRVKPLSASEEFDKLS